MGILDTAIGVALGVILAEATFRVLRFVVSFLYVYKHRDEMSKAKAEYKRAADQAMLRQNQRAQGDPLDGGYR